MAFLRDIRGAKPTSTSHEIHQIADLSAYKTKRVQEFLNDHPQCGY
ncbi:MAG: hypothetical protein OXQ31_00375 [Spirochaetaceae bacterium]|nr:hypothetical protein [Spirochaetaceae bacterium]